MITLVVVIFVLLLLLGMPLGFTVGVAGFTYFIFSDTLPIMVGVQRISSASQSFPLLAVPFFVLAGHMMNKTGITERLVSFSKLLVSWISGGLAHVTILLSAFMGGVSGSSVADASMQSRILGPSMINSGLSRGFTAGAIAVSSLITATIPPSIGLILYGFLGNVSIGKLFIAGIIPGILMTFLLMATAYIIAKKRGYKAETNEKPSFKKVMVELGRCKWALLFPVLLVVTIRFGIFTPSEAGAFAVVYAVVVGLFLHGGLRFKDITQALNDSVLDIGMIMLIILFSALLGYIIAYEQLPQDLATAATQISSNPKIILLMALLFLIVVGMVMEATVSVLLLTPILVPIITSAGIDPVHFGVLMMTVVTLGGMTPPVGVAMYAVCGILKCPTDEYIVESAPFIGAVLLLVLLMALFPGIILFLPNLLM